jgi:hypothetical protein
MPLIIDTAKIHIFFLEKGLKAKKYLSQALRKQYFS